MLIQPEDTIVTNGFYILQEVTIPEEEELSNQSQTDETKAEQLNTEGHRSKVPCIADWGSYFRFFCYNIFLIG